MKTWSDTVVAFAGHVSDHLGPVTKMIDSVMDRIVSTPTVQACGGTKIDEHCYYAYCNNEGYPAFGYDVITFSYQGGTCTLAYCGC